MIIITLNNDECWNLIFRVDSNLKTFLRKCLEKTVEKKINVNVMHINQMVAKTEQSKNRAPSACSIRIKLKINPL